MMIAVVGLWHLGTVTAACLASAGRDVVGFDDSSETVAGLAVGRLPVFEPGLEDLVRRGMTAGRLRWSSDPRDLKAAEILWITYDTPVDEEDRADVEQVVERVAAMLPFVREHALVLISSQLPVGSTRRVEELYQRLYPAGTVTFAYSPENLRLGRAIEAFTRPDRVVVGVRQAGDRERLTRLFQPFTERIEWMSVESAEMTKHALNAFLAVSVAFANEVAVLCEKLGADAREVERGLRTDPRIGARAYVRPGGAFGGGTLARDVAYLEEIGRRDGVPAHLISGVRQSNDAHKKWSRRRLREVLGDLRSKTIAVFGLTYKSGTDTLRRSNAVETCRWLAGQGASVHVYDLAVPALPAGLGQSVKQCPTPQGALRGASALLVETESPELARLTAEEMIALMEEPIVVDPAGLLESRLGADGRFRYLAVGRRA
jgi:UDPglucose 6-dehydrogenase